MAALIKQQLVLASKCNRYKVIDCAPYDGQIQILYMRVDVRLIFLWMHSHREMRWRRSTLRLEAGCEG